ncbi:hypothetical protein [Neptunomonas sp.]|uniref:hypothetical protein n=1 Tax=Neptunomonas sp. TaxID=1971898 RepID=UPI0035612DEE
MDTISPRLKASQLSWTRLFGYRYIVAAITVCLFFASASRLSAETLICSNPMFSVVTSEPSLAKHTCTVATAAAERLAACHIPQRDAIELYIVDRIVHSDISLLGIYKRGEKTLEVTSPAHFTTTLDPHHIYSLIPAHELFDSMIYHELTHAFLDQQPGGSIQYYANHEYMAYSMQMEALSPASRQIFIDAAGGDSEISNEQLNEFVALAKPPTFAAWSWQHFAEPQHGCDFFEKLITGETSLELSDF